MRFDEAKHEIPLLKAKEIICQGLVFDSNIAFGKEK